MDKFWSPLVSRLQPYVPGEQPRDQHYIKLNTNENPYPPSPQVITAINRHVDAGLRLYPDPQALSLCEVIAGATGVGVRNVFVGNGSDEVLALAFMAFFSGAEQVNFPDITYSFYPVYCGLFGVKANTIPLEDDFSLDLRRYNGLPGGIIFPNPNAPTGRETGLQAIEALLAENPDTLVIIDEAYVDFGAKSALSLVGRYPNLLVIQTFSKSRSLAGMRVGFAIGDKGLIEALNRVKDSFNSYPLDRLAQSAATAAMQDGIYFNNIRRKIIETRTQTVEGLEGLGFEVVPSQANFVFVRHPQHDAGELYEKLRSAGILVRYFNKPRIDQYLRITIGTDDEMQQLLQRLPVLLAD
ncbi:histidinol-phosphate transaminase [Granulosicoccaceae sp. 1_MG-2023]|nr:histidinol-phosphate transaminase [Granulosicoccaceae sp. 1_MG-2023]